jgi:hypothetical protein
MLLKLSLAVFIFHCNSQRASSQCPPGSFVGLEPSECYTVPPQKRSWVDAEVVCMEAKGNLVSIADATINSFVHNMTEYLYTDFWAGGNDFNNETWQWSDGTPFYYTNWQKDNGTTMLQSCLAIEPLTGKWAKQLCDDEKPFLCKIPSIPQEHPTSAPCPACPSRSTAPPQPTCPPPVQVSTCPPRPSPSPTCPSGFTSCSGSNFCYQVVAGSYTTAQAEYQCQLRGGNLATIDSSNATDCFISMTSSVTTDRVWIGLFDVSQDSHHTKNSLWTWLDGSKYFGNYYNWNTISNEPTGGEAYCVDAYTKKSGQRYWPAGSWNDEYCSVSVPAFCSAPLLNN